MYDEYEYVPVLGIQIHIFLDLMDPDPLVTGRDPNPSLFS
jgi:hypothetical protein